jgi:hypothetical protein
MFIPDFIAHAGSMTHAIEADHPGVNLTFGMVDYHQAIGYDDGDGWVYHVDVGSFVNATTFPGALNASTFLNAFNDIDLSDNLFRASSISALYGALEGDGLNWTVGAHHVIVSIAAQTPNDPNYPINQCVAPLGNLATSCLASTCEPSNAPVGTESPTNYTIPTCEGWANSSNGNASDSIAALASNSSACTASVLHQCTVDTITLPSALTDPNSSTWVFSNGTHSVASRLTNNSASVIAAGCDLANATNGSWDGPLGVVCPNGAVGTISDDVHNSSTRQAQNDSLVLAVGNISVGVVPGPNYGGGVPGAPLVRFVLAAGIRPAPLLNMTVACAAADGTTVPCDSSAQVFESTYVQLSWNWSTVPEMNTLGWGDVWTASFDVVVDQSTNGSVPLDLCAAVGCAATPAGEPNSGVTILPAGSRNDQFQSFPMVSVAVVAPPLLRASFTARAPVIDLGAEAQFTLGVSGGVPPYELTVHFADGTQSQWTTMPTMVAHVYGSPGQYGATATLVDHNGTAESVTSIVTVLYPLQLTLATPDLPVMASSPSGFSLLVTGGLAPYQVEWEFGDGSPSNTTLGSSTQVLHLYATPGSFDGNVTVVDATGAISVDPFVIEVVSTAGGSGSPLTASAAADAGSPVGNPCSPSGVAVSLTGAASGGVAPYNWTWNFEDGSASAYGPTVTHVYLAGHGFAAELTVTDAAGASASATVNGTSGGVAGPSCGATSTPTSGLGALSGSGMFVVLGAAIVVVAIVAVVVLARRRR